MPALAMAVGKSFDGKFTVKIEFPFGVSDRVLCIIIADVDIGSLKSLHTLFEKYLDHMLVKFEQNGMVRTIQNFELFDQK